MNNAITVVGYVGQNPQTLSFGDTGNKLVKFSVAVREYSANTEEKKTLWIDVDAWNGLGDRVLKTITKGREVVINGRLAVSNYVKEEDGVRREVSKPIIKMTSFHLCGKRPLIDAEPQAEEASDEDQEGLA
jgi:Single-stranded DNA-binding protein